MAKAKELRAENKGLRNGQAHMIALEQLAPGLARALPDSADCFYDDRKLFRFLDEL
jgi:hypothetical protein